MKPRKYRYHNDIFGHSFVSYKESIKAHAWNMQMLKERSYGSSWDNKIISKPKHK